MVWSIHFRFHRKWYQPSFFEWKYISFFSKSESFTNFNFLHSQNGPIIYNQEIFRAFYWVFDTQQTKLEINKTQTLFFQLRTQFFIWKWNSHWKMSIAPSTTTILKSTVNQIFQIIFMNSFFSFIRFNKLRLEDYVKRMLNFCEIFYWKF